MTTTAELPAHAFDPTDVIDGGERVIHLWPNDCYLAHLSIYHFAKQFCQDGVVLDAGSGTGYGSAYLAANGAKFVYGIDVGARAVAFSDHHFSRPNLKFQVMDLENIAGFPSRHFDLIFSSNTLEHVGNVLAFFHAAWRLLKPAGTLLIVVPPINTEEARAADLANKYHLNSWSPRQWHHVLGQFFGDIQCYQHYFDKPGVTLNFFNHPSEVKIHESDFLFTPVTLEEMYHVQTFSAVFVVRRPRPLSKLPAASSPLTFVDNSFTRLPPAPEQPAAAPPAEALARPRSTRYQTEPIVPSSPSSSGLLLRLLRSPILRPVKAVLPHHLKTRIKSLVTK